MGVGVIFNSAKVINPRDGRLHLPSCEEAADRAKESARDLLEQEGVPYRFKGFSMSVESGDPWNAEGFNLTLLGYAEGAADLEYAWRKYPERGGRTRSAGAHTPSPSSHGSRCGPTISCAAY